MIGSCVFSLSLSLEYAEKLRWSSGSNLRSSSRYDYTRAILGEINRQDIRLKMISSYLDDKKSKYYRVHRSLDIF